MSLVKIDPGQKDIKKITGNVFGLAVLAALGFAAYVYLLPLLLTVVWGTVELAVGIIVGAFLLFTITNGKFWRALRYMSEALSQFLLGWIIEMNPFNILEYRLEVTEEDAEQLLKYNKQLKGKAATVKEKLEQNEAELKQNVAKLELVNRQLAHNPNDLTAQNTKALCASTITSCTEYIESIQPIYNDLNRLVDFTDRAYSTARSNITAARQDLAKKRDMFEIVTTASNALDKAWKALLGRKDLNNDAEKAIDSLKKNIGEKIGNIQTGIKVTGQFMDNKDLENASKLQVTLKQLENVNLDAHTYGSTLTPEATKIELKNQTGGNKYMNYLN